MHVSRELKGQSFVSATSMPATQSTNPFRRGPLDSHPPYLPQAIDYPQFACTIAALQQGFLEACDVRRIVGLNDEPI